MDSVEATGIILRHLVAHATMEPEPVGADDALLVAELLQSGRFIIQEAKP